jgi:transposase
MSHKRITMINIRQIFRLYEGGTSLREMERLLNVSRRTITKYVSLFEASKLKYSDVQNKSDEELSTLFLEPPEPDNERYDNLQIQLPDMAKELGRVGVTKNLLWGEYKTQDPGGYNYSQFSHYLRQYVKHGDVTMHFEHKYGDKMFVDYAGKKLQITDKLTGETQAVEVYLAILGGSQMTYVEASMSQKKEDFISATENALHFFEGVPRAIVPDNLKSAVTKCDRYEPVLNEDFANFALHYQTAILPARSRKPRDKSLVEGVVKIIYTRIYAKLRNRIFHTLIDLNEAIWEELETHNKTKLQNRDHSRYELFKENEQAKLTALPADMYEMKQYAFYKAQNNCHIYFGADKHYYSVPYQYVGKKLKVAYSRSTVEIYSGYRRIAFHQRDHGKYGYSTIKEHLPAQHRFVMSWSLEKFINWASDIGEETELYIRKILDSKEHPEQAYKSCMGILSFAKKMGNTRLNRACQRGIYYNGYSYTTIKNILTKGLDTLELQEPEQFTISPHENVRGQSYYV